MLGWRCPSRAFSTSFARTGGQKAKRRKQSLRADNPHLEFKSVDATASTAALAHFDDFYSGLYKTQWSSMRLGLLSQAKYCAVVNNFGDREATVARLEELGCVDVGHQYREAQARQAPHIKQQPTVISEGLTVEEEVLRLEQEEQLSALPSSLAPEQAEGRLMDPEEAKLKGGAATALYDFVPSTVLKGMEDFVEESDYYQYYKQVSKDEVRTVVDPSLPWPSALRCYTFPRGVIQKLPAPKTGLLGTSNYYCMDAASLLPVLALDLRPGCSVLDMCSGPGGKALVMLQTLYPASLVCNDISSARVKRVIGVLDQFLGREKDGGIGGVRKSITLTRSDGADLTDYECYDRVLVDAPCYADRHAVSSDEANVFVKTQIKDRLKMPERQAKLLKTGLMQLKPGGCLVYSTCTLSPIQNDGVVHMALKALWQDTTLDFEVCDLTEAVKPMRFLCKMVGMKYGQMVVPFLPNNFGPMYFAKIRRIP